MNTMSYRKLGMALTMALVFSWPTAYLAGMEAGNQKQLGTLHHKEACDCPPLPIKSFRMGLSDDQPLFPWNTTP